MTGSAQKIGRLALLCGAVVGSLMALTGAATPSAKTPEQSQVKTRLTNKERSNMKTLDLTIKLNQTKFITGESLPVEVTLENAGGSPVEVPDPGVGSDLQYVVRSRTAPGPAYYLSWAQAVAERYLERFPSRKFPCKMLAPGSKESYKDDLATFQVSAIGPGEYAVSAAYEKPSGRVESVGAAITIAPPHIMRMVTLAGSGEKGIAVVFAHSPDAKHATIYQVENAAGRPGDGAAYPRKEGIGIAELRGLAVAIDLADNEGRRWLAWDEGAKLAAAVGQERYLSHLVAPVAHGLHGASLSPVGWQLTNDDALFVALGGTAGGHAALVTASFSLSSPGTVKTIPVAGPANPDGWAAQYHVVGSDAQIHLVTAAHAGHTVKVTRQTLALGTGKAGTPTTLIEHAGPLVGMAMAPVDGGNDTDRVDVLFGPDPGTGYMSLLRLPLAGGATRANWDFFAPKNTGGKRPTAWAIPRLPLVPPMVATHVGDKIYVRRVGGEWSVVVDGVPHVEHLSIEAFGEGNVIAVWSDPAFGIRYHVIP